MDAKGPDAFRTISEVAGDLDLPQHVLRFWETRFSQIKPLKRGGGRRYYRPDDVDLLRGIRHLLYDEGYTIKGVQRILKERGIRYVSGATDGMPDEIPPAQPVAAGPVNGTNGAHAQTAAPAPSDATPASPPQAAQAAASLQPEAADDPVAAEPDPAPHAAPERPTPPAQARPPGAAAQSRPAAQSSEPVQEVIEAEEDVPRGILLDEPPPRRAEPRSFIDKIRGVPETLPPAATVQGSLSRDDIRRLQATLFELLECKRILDRARSG